MEELKTHISYTCPTFSKILANLTPYQSTIIYHIHLYLYIERWLSPPGHLALKKRAPVIGEKPFLPGARLSSQIGWTILSGF